MRTSPALTTAWLLVAAVSGCTAGDAGSDTETPGVTANLPQHGDPVELDPSEFTVGIDNIYWPMPPGTRWVYRETDEEGEELRVVVTVTSETKRIANGVSARVVRDTVSKDGEVIEDTFDWFAQDSEGTIWYLGEDTAEFENGELSSREGSFEAGVDGAMPGVVMPGEPAAGLSYREEYYEGHAEDNGAVLSLDEMAGVPAGHFDNTLLVKGTNALEPEVLEYKLYAPDVGPVLALGVSGGAGREELLEHTRVSAEVARAAGTTPLGEPYD